MWPKVREYVSKCLVSAVSFRDQLLKWGKFVSAPFMDFIDNCAHYKINKMTWISLGIGLSHASYEPCSEKTGFLHMRKQRRRSASR